MTETNQELRKQARTGGTVTRETHGIEHFSRAGRKGGEATRKRGAAYYQKIGRAGGSKVVAELGAEHYQAMGRAGAKKREANTWNRAIEAAAQALLQASANEIETPRAMTLFRAAGIVRALEK